MDNLCLPAALESSRRVLVAGAGGGFDVYAGLPIYERLRSLGKKVFLANLSFVSLENTDAQALTPALYRVGPRTTGEELYFPERALAQFLSGRGEEVEVYAFEKLGVAPVRDAYRYLVRSLGLDTIVLVDGGTDILLRGDEAGLGTPAEDMTSLAAVAAMDVPTRMVACVGFGVDTFHGVCHANWLENVAALTSDGAFLGATALLNRMPEVRLYIDAVKAADLAMSRRPSIVNGSIVSAIEGRFGDYHRSKQNRQHAAGRSLQSFAQPGQATTTSRSRRVAHRSANRRCNHHVVRRPRGIAFVSARCGHPDVTRAIRLYEMDAPYSRSSELTRDPSHPLRILPPVRFSTLLIPASTCGDLLNVASRDWIDCPNLKSTTTRGGKCYPFGAYCLRSDKFVPKRIPAVY